MANLLENALGLVASVSGIDFNAVAATNLYTVPAGKLFIPHSVMIHEITAAMALSDATFGKVGALTDFLNTQDFNLLNAAGSAGICQPVTNANIVKIIEYVAGDVFAIDITTAVGGACTATVSVFGFVLDA